MIMDNSLIFALIGSVTSLVVAAIGFVASIGPGDGGEVAPWRGLSPWNLADAEILEGLGK